MGNEGFRFLSTSEAYQNHASKRIRPYFKKSEGI